MRLLIQDTITTAMYAYPLRAGWVAPEHIGDTEIVLDPTLDPETIGPDDCALIAAGGVGFVAQTHKVVLSLAVVADGEGPVQLRVPARPDEIERTSVRLLDVDASAEILARAVLRPFFGITVDDWTHDDTGEAQAVVAGGVEALRPVEGGFVEDLCRAWFISTGHGTVLHVLVVPAALAPSRIAQVVALLRAALDAERTHRRDMRRALATEHELEPVALAVMFGRLFTSIDPDDPASLMRLLRQGAPGTRYPIPRRIDYVEDEGG